MLKKINTFLLYFLVLLVPFNIRYIFNFDSTKNLSLFKEQYLIFLNLFDITFVFFLLSFFWSEHQRLFPAPKEKIKKLLQNPLFYFFLWTIISLFLANPNDFFSRFSLYKVLRFSELLLFFILSRHFLQQYTVLTYTKFIIFTAGVFQSFLAIWQFIQQKSLGLFWLGESHLGPQILGLARFEFGGEKFIRAYGTFPHPNVLGIFLVFSLASGFSLIISKKNLFKQLRWPYKFLFLLELLSIFTALLLTYSRAAIGLSLLIIIPFLYQERNQLWRAYQKFCQKIKVPAFLRTTLAISLGLGSLFLIYNLIAPRLCFQCPHDKSLFFRKIYRSAAQEIIKEHPLTGVGLGNFITTEKQIIQEQVSSWRIQPVHNLYLLITAELGWPGLALFILSIIFYLRPNFSLASLKKHPLKLFFIVVLLAAFLDHYFWTISQGQKIFWLALALASLPEEQKQDSSKYHFSYLIIKVRKIIRELS